MQIVALELQLKRDITVNEPNHKRFVYARGHKNLSPNFFESLCFITWQTPLQFVTVTLYIYATIRIFNNDKHHFSYVCTIQKKDNRFL